MRLDYLVLYVADLPASRSFYESLGLVCREERHGNGPLHYSMKLEGGLTIELFPRKQNAPSGRVRIGLSAATADEERAITDPDGNVVVLCPRDPN